MFVEVLTTTMMATTSRVASNGHPFSSLNESEIRDVARLIRNQWPESTEIQFKVLTLLEPPKEEALLYLDAEHGQFTLPFIERRAWVNYYIRKTVRDIIQFALLRC